MNLIEDECDSQSATLRRNERTTRTGKCALQPVSLNMVEKIESIGGGDKISSNFKTKRAQLTRSYSVLLSSLCQYC